MLVLLPVQEMVTVCPRAPDMEGAESAQTGPRALAKGRDTERVTLGSRDRRRKQGPYVPSRLPTLTLHPVTYAVSEEAEEQM